MTDEIPLFVVYDNDTKKVYEQCFSEEAAEYYAEHRENCSVGVVLINECELEVVE